MQFSCDKIPTCSVSPLKHCTHLQVKNLLVTRKDLEKYSSVFNYFEKYDWINLFLQDKLQLSFE